MAEFSGMPCNGIFVDDLEVSFVIHYTLRIRLIDQSGCH
jgi:hypothetical protein